MIKNCIINDEEVGGCKLAGLKLRAMCFPTLEKVKMVGGGQCACTSPSMVGQKHSWSMIPEAS
ncbi:hypothetical protein WN51_06948 [Melipona quadrifasciata]|uniref:Uncharacterized protein n=1 Tax=Melipona quadrifasciata TaxID=166423 RepID=A0A0N0U308_9HYME|nr:hypothetical protein WN51_06948 [Melipona quadrifasciata]